MFADGIEVYEEAYLGQETEGGGGGGKDWVYLLENMCVPVSGEAAQ